MIRTALTPRWLALLALALAVATAFSFLGRWQLDRSQQDRDDSGRQVVHALTDVAAPQEALAGDALTGLVRATGTFDAAGQLVVVDRPLDGAPGRWVLTPLRVEQGGTTATLAVVRGWVPQDADVPTPPTGVVDLVGRLQGSELPTGVVPGLAADEVRAVSVADLVNRWEPPVYAGYLVVTDPVPAPLTPVPVQDPAEAGVNLVNLSYALQWWVFAAFAVFLWWRMLADTYRRHQEVAAEGGPPDGDGSGGGGGGSGGENDQIRAERGAER